MSIQSAMQAGVSGLGSQARKFATIADNISNSETIGYKRSDATFVSQVIDSGSKTAYTAGGVSNVIERDISRVGSIRGSDSATDISINGGGFFLIKGGLPENQASEQTLLTRVGNGQIDQDGYLRLANGYYLQGVPTDADGVPTTSIAQSISMPQAASAPTPSSSVGIRTNLPADDGTLSTQGTDISTTTTYVDELGSDRPLKFTWTPAAGGTANRWRLQIFDVDTSATVPVYDQNIDFDVTGATAGTPSAIPLATGNTVTVTGFNGMSLDVSLDLTQYDYDYNPFFTSDGVTVSDFSGVEIAEDGTVFSVFENGYREPRFRLLMGDVANPDGLRPVDSNAYQISIDSGDLIERFPGEGSVGTVQAFTLEGSNVDIAEELTDMITTQRAYSANASIITTSDEMLEEVVRLKR